MKTIIGLVGRFVFWVGFAYIIISAVYFFYKTEEIGWAIISFFMAPFTYLIFPWTHGLTLVFIVSIIGYWVSTFLGELEPVD